MYNLYLRFTSLKYRWQLSWNASAGFFGLFSCSSLLSGGMGERIGRAEVRELGGWVKDSLVDKAKAGDASKAK